MFRLEKHIAVSFLLVFLLPIVYQPAHTIRHRSQKHHSCAKNSHKKQQNNPDFQKNEHCYICEYEFTVTDLPTEFNIPFTEVFLNKLKPVKVQNIFSIDIILHTSPRAPPFLS